MGHNGFGSGGKLWSFTFSTMQVIIDTDVPVYTCLLAFFEMS
jgi:hypothetical protein